MPTLLCEFQDRNSHSSFCLSSVMKKITPNTLATVYQEVLLNTLRLLQLSEFIQQCTAVSVLSDHVDCDLPSQAGFAGIDLITPQLGGFPEFSLLRSWARLSFSSTNPMTSSRSVLLNCSNR